jgi:RimJ/RimL family protein N-acetyltransferase
VTAVILRAVTESDFAAFYEQQADPESVAMAAFPARERGPHDDHWRWALAQESTLARTIVVDGQVAGHVVSFLRDGVGDVEVGYWVDRSLWGRGVATAALAQFLEEEPRRPLTAGVATHNAGSRRVLEKCGFVVTETIPDAMGDGIDEWHLRLG